MINIDGKMCFTQDEILERELHPSTKAQKARSIKRKRKARAEWLLKNQTATLRAAWNAGFVQGWRQYQTRKLKDLEVHDNLFEQW